VYNLGGRRNSISILETIKELADRGYSLNWTYNRHARTGDHICYISRSHFPNWRMQYDLPRNLDDIVSRHALFARSI